MKNNRTREVLVCGVWGCADTDRPASMLSAPAFIYHFGWEVSFALVSQPFNRTFITRDCSRSVACITNSTSPNNLQMESWWESLEFSSVFTSTPPFLKLQPGKILRGKINAWGKQQAHLDILMSARCSRLEEKSSYLYLYLLNLSLHSRSHGWQMEQVFGLSTIMTSYTVGRKRCSLMCHTASPWRINDSDPLCNRYWRPTCKKAEHCSSKKNIQ